MKLSSSQLVTSFLVSLSILVSINVNADNATASKAMWKEVPNQAQASQQLAAKQDKTPITARFLELNVLGLKSLLNDSSYQNSVAARTVVDENVDNTISLPLPDGSEVNLKITLSSVMSDALAAQFPEIKTWKVSGVSNDISGTIDFTYQGFHAMLTMPDGDTVFIEPNKLDVNAGTSNKVLLENGQYLSLSKRANKESFKSEFSCGVHSDSPLNFHPAAKGLGTGSASPSEKLQARPASDLITYRLAVATTGEYTQFHGGTVSDALSAIATTINRINEIYERDLSVRFKLIDEQSELIYLDPNTDPYTNNDASKLIQENDQNLSINGVLSKAKYDIGHVFGAGNAGGLAQVRSVCDNSLKAQAATGIGNPTGDAFDLDYVAHEMGHQMGGTHTFNSDCDNVSQRVGLSAVEPGSGSTIMSYAGICQENNIQLSVDDYFHVASISQIRNFSRDGDGSGCGVLTSTSNENPTVSTGNDFTVPARTPVFFTATGADTDNDVLSYTWEQTDAGSISNVNVDTEDNALFRSRLPSSSGTRFIPRLSDLFNKTNAIGETTATGDPLVEKNRSMEMVVTVRDGKGGLQTDLVNMNVFDTGESFILTSQKTSQTIARGDQHTIRWAVAGTDASPISCTTVNIGLTNIDGEGIDIVSTPNDGQQQITIPANAPDMSNARFIISCVSSGFFNISSGRLSVGDVNTGGGGGGSMSIFILSLFSMLIWRRKYSS